MSIPNLSAALAAGIRPNTIILIGDSIMANNGDDEYSSLSTTSPRPLNYAANGIFSWANVFLRQQFKVLKNFGVGGWTTTQILTELGGVFSLPTLPGWALVEGGTNDLGSTTDPDVVFGNLRTIHQRLQAAGIRSIATTLIPGTGRTTAQALCVASVNQKLRDFCRDTGTPLVDIRAAVADPSTGAYLAGTSDDGIHPNVNGAGRIGCAIANVLRPMLPALDTLVGDNSDNLNLLSNGAMIGSTGGVATSWTASGAGITSSKVASTDNEQAPWQQFVAASTSSLDFYSTFSTGYTAGTTALQAEMEFEIDAGTTLTQLVLQMYSNPNGGIGQCLFTSLTGQTVWVPGFKLSGVLRTPPAVVSTGTTLCYPVFHLAGFVGTVRVRKARVRVAT